MSEEVVMPPGENVGDGRVRGSSDLEEAALVRRIHGWLGEAKKKESTSRKEMEEDHNFVAGHQWEEADASKLKQDKRPALTLNHTLSSVQAICGEERLNRQDIKYYGRDEGDEETSFAFTEIAKWVMDECNGDFEMSKASRDCATGGIGWMEAAVEYDDDPLGKIEFRRVPWKEMWKDPLSIREDLRDCRWLIREKHVHSDVIHNEWPEKAGQIAGMKAEMTGDGGMATETTPRNDAYSSGGDKPFRPLDNTWQLLEVCWYEMVDGALVVNPMTGEIEEMTKVKLDRLLKINQVQKDNYTKAVAGAVVGLDGSMIAGDPRDQQVIDGPPPQDITHTKRKVKIFHQAFVCGSVLLEKKKHTACTRAKMFPYIQFAGVFDEKEEAFFGIVRNIKDPQRMYNVGQSTILEWTQRSPKHGWIAAKGALHDKKNWKENGSKSGFVGEYNLSKGKPDVLRPPAMPRHLMDMPQTNLDAIRQIGGVTVELLGVSQKETPGVVLEQRRKQALTVLQTFFDNWRLARRQIGRLMAAYIQEYISDDRKVRILGPDGPQYVVAMKDFKYIKFDAVVEDNPESPNSQMETLHLLQTSLPMMLKMGFPVPPQIVDAFPLKPTLKKAWKEYIAMMQAQEQMMNGQGAGGPPPMQ